MADLSETPWGDVSGPQWDLAGRLAAGVRILLDGSDFMGTEEMGEGLARVVARWLRDQAEALGATSSPSLDNDLRHDIHVAAGEFIALADKIEQGEA